MVALKGKSVNLQRAAAPEGLERCPLTRWPAGRVSAEYPPCRDDLLNQSQSTLAGQHFSPWFPIYSCGHMLILSLQLNSAVSEVL